ncbi:MAG: hypothetical protein QOG10_7186 [Kribbellaceae bacterium]|nr:hypothetical protein [Kribbellaceae bacterium]
MPDLGDSLECQRCRRPVRASAATYEVFERMHYVCFHYEFEHDPADPDEVCSAGGCPSGALVGGLEQAAATAQGLALDANAAEWENDTLDRYLGALAAWLVDSNGYYLNQDRVPPSNAWEVIVDALNAARTYE